MLKGEVLFSGKRCVLVQGLYCYQIFDRESNAQIFGTLDLETAKRKYAQLEGKAK